MNWNAAFPVTGMATSSNQSSVFWTLSHCWKKNKRAWALKVYSQHVKYYMLRCIMESVGGVTVCEAQKLANINVKHLWTDIPSELCHCCQKRQADVCRCVAFTCYFFISSRDINSFSLPSCFRIQVWSHLTQLENRFRGVEQHAVVKKTKYLFRKLG